MLRACKLSPGIRDSPERIGQSENGRKIREGGAWNEVIYIASFDILIVPEQLHEEQLEAA